MSGDFNAHHIAFGCQSTKGRGQELFNLIDDLDLCILNDGRPTTINRPKQTASAIDVSFISGSLAPLCDWSVHDDTMGSYHYPTITEISLRIDKYHLNSPVDRFIYKKADWATYTTYTLSKTMFNDFILQSHDPISTYNNFCFHLDTLKEMSIPKLTKTNTFISRPPSPWWNSICEQSVIASYNALKLYRKEPTIENYINYKRKDAQKKRTILEQKKIGWNNLCNTFNRNTHISKIWNLLKMFKGIRPKNKSYTNEFISPLLDKLSDNSNLIEVDQLNILFEINNHNPNSKFLLDPFSWSEFLTSLHSRRNTTPGLDDYPYIVIKNLDVSAQKLFLSILNLLWRNKSIPQSWKTQCVVPILKPDKSPELASSYRPISLSSCLGKIFENMVKVRLDWYVESKCFIPHIQYGFRRGRSSADSFTSLISDLKNAKHRKLNTVCVFLDVQSAFDSVDPGILVQIMSRLGVPGHLCKWIFNFLNNRTIYARHNNILYGPKCASKGTMQGATLSPLLYNIYTSEICKYVNNRNVNILQFADDIVFYSSNYNLEIAIDNMNQSLFQLLQYYNDRLHLKINPSKSSVMFFGNETSNSNIIYNNEIINRVTSKKFLGIILDPKLTFEEHIKYISKNAHTGLNVIRSLCGVTWGADPKILSILYKSIVRSHLDYSSLAYMNSSHVNKLDILQNKALRIISGAMCSTPIRAMEVETKVMPLILRRILLAERYCLKLIASNNTQIISKIVPYIDRTPRRSLTTAQGLLCGNSPTLSDILLEIDNSFFKIRKQFPWPCYSFSYQCISHPINVVQQTINNNSEMLQFLEENTMYYVIYTDGSKASNYVHAALYDPQAKFSSSFILHEPCSIFTAEAYAVYQALMRIREINNIKYFLIISDSLSLITALSTLTVKYKSNYILYFIKQIIYQYHNKNIQIFFLWVPSHKGISGNEMADKTAYEGVNAVDVRNTMYVPMSDYLQCIDQNIQKLWLEMWKKDQDTKGKWYGSIQESLPARPWYHRIQDATRDFITIINRLRFGHNSAPSHLARLGIIANKTCSHCNSSDGTVEHIIFDCQKFLIDRLVLASELSDVENKCDLLSRPPPLKQLLQDEHNYKHIYKYIKNTIKTI
ncbi:unnamed protein product [Euphydryas editha]|uniref:RNA-directed DNA polymerase from mobile element jockey n=1 Tax=Euphydryas editha TaxID=104508 RepID=A0AAU9TQU0_EUPED|nr:unnamed protein product [Euphydryas editha]